LQTKKRSISRNIAGVTQELAAIIAGQLTFQGCINAQQKRDGDTDMVTEKKRDYKKEYKAYHGRPAQIKARAERNAARAKMGLGVGNPKEVDHKVPLSKGGSNNKRNLRVVSQKTNRSKGANRK